MNRLGSDAYAAHRDLHDAESFWQAAALIDEKYAALNILAKNAGFIDAADDTARQYLSGGCSPDL